MDAESSEFKRELPKDLEAERALLGAIMQDANLLNDVSEKVGTLEEEEFFSERHRLIYGALKSLANSTDNLEPTMVSDWLETNGLLDDVGGRNYVSSLVEYAGIPSTAVIDFAMIIRAKAKRRAMIKVSEDIIELCYNPQGRNVKEIFDEASGQIFNLVEKSHTVDSGPQPAGARIVDLVHRLSREALQDEMTGVPTDFAELDELCQGLQPGSLNIIAARPSVGKTSFAMNIVSNIATNPDVKYPALVFSLEMPTDQLLLRLLSSYGRTSMNNIKTGNISNDSWAHMVKKINALTYLKDGVVCDKLYIDDSGDITPLELRARARKLHLQHGGLSVIMIDYVQLMRSQTKAANRTLEIGEISRSLKLLSKELNVPILALAQLNREVDNRKDHRPLNSDLRESGSLEQDADMIMFLQREAVYGPGPGGEDNSNEALLIIGKNRNGATADIDLVFVGEYTSFYGKEYLQTHPDLIAPNANANAYPAYN